MEITSIVAAVVSIAVGIFAIWLSLTFYKMSSRNMENVIEASKGLQANMNRLETMFNKIYSGTLSTTRESVSEKPKQPWPEATPQEDFIREEVERRAERKVEELRKALERGRSGVPEKPVIQETRIDSVKKETSGVADRAIAETKKAETEAIQVSIREKIEKQITFYQHRGYKGIISEFLMDDIISETPQLTIPDIEYELRKMKEEAIIDWEGDKLGPNSHIEFKK
jgi:hypothetical protein